MPNPATPSASDADLEVRDLKKRWGRRSIVKGVSLSVRRGEVVGLLGPNGSGKTTIFYLIAGLTAPDAGTLFLAGQPITKLPIHRRVRLGLGYLPQDRSVFRQLSVEQNLLAVLEWLPLSREERQERLSRALDEFRLHDIRKRRGYQLSGGESRRVELARALVQNPTLLLLDEPFAGVDPIGVLELNEMIRNIRKDSIGILITDHNARELLSVCDRAYLINEGELLAEGTPEELLTNEKARRIYFSEDFRL